MQPMKYLTHWLLQHANNEHYLFSSQDLRSLLPELSDAAFKTLLSRTAQSGYLTRICRGLYSVKHTMPMDGFLLFHAAAHLRSDTFNYISLETVLSDVGIISQVPINRIFIMSSARSNVISCGNFGVIEFIHTTQKPTDVMHQLTYDTNCHLWRANVALALRDMKMTHRNCDLINWDIAHEYI